MLWQAPQPQTAAQRSALIERITAQIREKYQNRLVAIGLYGSVAQGIALPHSDIELFCVLDGESDEFNYEWIYGAGKIEVNFRSIDVLHQEAALVEEDWALTHGCYVYAKSLYGADSFFMDLKQRALSAPPSVFNRAISDIIIYEFYEGMGKARNHALSGYTYDLPRLALHFAQYGALMLGLWHRHCYTTHARIFPESLSLAERPDEYDELCNEVMSGHLHDPQLIIRLLENFWVGVGKWAVERDIDMSSYMIAPF